MRYLLTALSILCMSLLPPAGAEAASSPAFNCAKAEGEAQELICKDDELARLDRETDRLFTLAVKGRHMDKAHLRELKATQRGWIKGRDDCWKADNLRDCILAEYVFRMHQLRQAYADARSQDAKGITIGPKVLNCKDLGAAVGVTFVNAGSSYAHLEWLDQDLFVKQVEAASGVKYQGQYLMDGTATFWTKGDEATFSLPGKPGYACKIEEVG